MNLKIYLIGICCVSASASFGQSARFSDEASDTTTINNILARAISIKDPNTRVEMLGRNFLDIPYQAATLESTEGEALTVNLAAMDCTTLIDNVMALAITAGENRLSWRDFIFNLEKIRYRGGKIDGYASRLHYISDWVVDNVHRGNFEEVTNRYDLASYEIKTIDYITQNRDKYPALADSTEFARMKSAEIGYRNHRYPFIKTRNLPKATKGFIKAGDIVALTTKVKGLDVAHMGIIVFNAGEPYLLHASSKAGKVIVDPLKLTDYLSRNHNLTGIRIFRLKE